MTREKGVGFDAQEWYRKFCELYNVSAGSLLTELGLFYDRHRKFVDQAQRSDPSNPEYTDEEWNRVLASLLAQLAGEMGLVQAPDPTGRGRLDWYLPGVADRPTVVIRNASDATNSILTRELVDLARSGTHLSVFLMCPDYPLPEGSSSFEAATRAWSRRIEERLVELGPPKEVLALMISAYSFDVPAPWHGFVWNPASGSLESARL